MSDKYNTFHELSHTEGPDSFQIRVYNRGTDVVIIAPHAGKIEKWTSEICLEIAGETLSCYLFEGVKKNNNRDLHITSSNFDEPECIKIVTSSKMAIAIHGQSGEKQFINVGGGERSLSDILIAKLKSFGFDASRLNMPHLSGTNPNNICNKGKAKAGIQLEISLGLRNVLIADKTQMNNLVKAIHLTLDENGLL